MLVRKSVVNDRPAHPAPYHMLDAARVVHVLLLQGHRQRDLFCMPIALHDLGKTSHLFRGALQAGSLQVWRHRDMT